MRSCRSLSTVLMLSLFFLLPAWGDVPDAPPMGACYMGYGKTLEAAQSRQLSLDARITRFLYQPGGLEIAYEGSQKDGDEVTHFIRLVGVRRGTTTTLISTVSHAAANNDQANQDPAPYSLAGWSGDGRYLLISQDRYVTVPGTDNGYSDTDFVCIDVGADPVHTASITLPGMNPQSASIVAGVTRYWWSPNRTRLLFARQGIAKQGESHTPTNVFCQVYDLKAGRQKDVTYSQQQIVRGWIDDTHLLLDDSPQLTEFTPSSKAHYASYDLLTGTQSEIPKPAKLPARFNDMEYAPGAFFSPKAAYLRLDDEAHRIQDQQRVGAVDTHALWVRRTKGPKLQSAAPVGLTPGPDNPQAVWSPTGAQIAFIAHGDLFVTDLTMRNATVAEKYKAGETLTCQEEQVLASGNLKQVGLALLQYCQDWDERFPPADQWQDRVTPYVEDTSLFNIAGHPVVYHMPAGMTLASIDAPADTVLGTIELPCATVTLMADGHVKALPKPTP